MKKAVLSAFLLFVTAACLPLTPAPQPIGPTPAVDQAGTAQAMLKTAIVQTLTAQPSNSPTPLLNPATSTYTAVLPSPSETPTMTATTIVETASMDAAAATGTFTVFTSTPFATFPVGPATATLTPGVLTYGTLPPAVPFANITLINRAKTQAYISLQVVTAEGGPTIIEYPVSGKVKVQAPVGSYLYVAWVGGRKMVGEFKLHHDDDLEITLYRDRIEIQ